jgi:hypothetical protein
MKPTHRLCTVAFLAAAFCCFFAFQAQAQSDAAKSVLQTVTRTQNEILGMAEAMPADEYNFAPTKATFAPGSPANFATVRTYGQELTHIASMPFFLLAPYGVKPDPGVNPRSFASLTSKDDIINAVKESFAYENKVIATITPENAFKPMGPRNATLIGTLIMMFNDYGDHYGQMVEYLRMNGHLPPSTARQMQRREQGGMGMGNQGHGGGMSH